MAVVPGDARTQLPRDVHAAVGSQHDLAVLDRRNLGRQNRHDVHALVCGHEPLDHTRLDVLQDMGRVAVHRVGLAIVTNDEQVIRRTRAAGASCARCERECECDANKESFHADLARMSLLTSGTGMEP
jgi:hypothetical protein